MVMRESVIPTGTARAYSVSTPEASYEVFLATPMSVLDDSGYADHRGMVLRTVAMLEESLGTSRVYYAGQEITHPNAFSHGGHGVSKDFDALRKSRALFFIYPREAATSAIGEAGAALALKIPIVVFVRQGVAVPYFLRDAVQARSDAIGPVAIHEYDGEATLLRLVRQESRKLFDR
jgi:hypothetical protein